MSSEMDAINEAADAAVKEAAGEEPEVKEGAPVEETVDEGEAKEAEPATESESKEEETKEGEDDNPLNLTAEELKAINDDEKLMRAYKSMQRGLTKKTQTFAETRKQYEESDRMIQYIRANPDAALEEMAQARGYILAKKSGEDAAKAEARQDASDAVDALMEKYSKQLGPESTKLLLPFMREVAETIVKQSIEPIAERTSFLDRSAKESGIAAAVHEFGASVKESGEDWSDEIQEEMAKMMDRIVPGDNTPINDYLQTVYNAVSADRAKTAAVKRELSRLKKAQSEAEAARTVRPTPKEKRVITSDMSERDAIALATALAEEEARAM